jgi:hypothetical protein
LTGSIIVNTTNPYFVFGNASGAAVGQASDAGAFSSSAGIGDCIVSQVTKQLILQSGSGAGAIIINSGNNVSITNTLNATTLQQGGVDVSTLINNAVTGAIACSTINASSGYSYFGGLRLNGGETGNTIYQSTGNLGITANTGYTIPFAISNGNIITTINDTGMTFKDYSYINYANAIYFKNTTANKTILPGCTRLIQLLRVSIGLPLLQLAAEPFVTSYFTGRPVQPRPKRWGARTNGGVRQLSRGPMRWRAPIVAGRPVQPRPMRWGARISYGSASSAAGLRGGGPGISNPRLLRVVRSSDGLDSPGRSAQPRDTWWTLQGTAMRRAASSTAGLRGAVRMRWA